MQVYYQIQKWRGKNDDLNSLDWGGTIVNQNLLPAKANLPPVAALLLVPLQLQNWL